MYMKDVRSNCVASLLPKSRAQVLKTNLGELIFECKTKAGITTSVTYQTSGSSNS
jgi:hypothetical protein